MSDIYQPAFVPTDYDPEFFNRELRRIASTFSEMELEHLVFVPQAVEPAKRQDGMTALADGTNWNPGHGEGLYRYHSSHWHPMFPLISDSILSQTQIVNDATEHTIYTATFSADEWIQGEMFRAVLMGSYDTGASSDTFTLKFKLGATVLNTIVRESANNAVNFGWRAEFFATIRTAGASGVLIDFASLHDDNTLKLASDSTTHTVDTTASNTFAVTFQWGAAKAGNDFRLEQGFIEHYHP